MKFLTQLAITTALAAAAGAASAGGQTLPDAPGAAATPASATASANTSEATMAQAKKFLERFGYSDVLVKPGSKFTNLCGDGFDNATIFRAKYTNPKINVQNAEMGGMVCSNSATGAMKTYGAEDINSIARQAAQYKAPKM